MAPQAEAIFADEQIQFVNEIGNNEELKNQQTDPRMDKSMFDKNSFKESFRHWFAANPAATETEVREFCQNNIPAKIYLQYFWLVEQTIAWYQWQTRNHSSDNNDPATLAWSVAN